MFWDWLERLSITKLLQSFYWGTLHPSLCPWVPLNSEKGLLNLKHFPRSLKVFVICQVHYHFLLRTFLMLEPTAWMASSTCWDSPEKPTQWLLSSLPRTTPETASLQISLAVPALESKNHTRSQPSWVWNDDEDRLLLSEHTELTTTKHLKYSAIKEQKYRQLGVCPGTLSLVVPHGFQMKSLPCQGPF